MDAIDGDHHANDAGAQPVRRSALAQPDGALPSRDDVLGEPTHTSATGLPSVDRSLGRTEAL